MTKALSSFIKFNLRYGDGMATDKDNHTYYNNQSLDFLNYIL